MAGLIDHLTLILAGLAPGRSMVRDAPYRTARAMAALGARIAPAAAGFTVDGTGNGCLLTADGPLDFGDEIEAAMLLTGLVATYAMPTTIRCGGDPDGLADALAIHGVQFERVALGWTVEGPPTANPARHDASAWTDAMVLAVALAALNAPGRTSLTGLAAGSDALVACFARFHAGASAQMDRLVIDGRAPLAPDAELGP